MTFLYEVAPALTVEELRQTQAYFRMAWSSGARSVSGDVRRGFIVYGPRVPPVADSDAEQAPDGAAVQVGEPKGHHLRPSRLKRAQARREDPAVQARAAARQAVAKQHSSQQMDIEAAAAGDAAKPAAASAAGARPSSSTASAAPSQPASSGGAGCAASSTRGAESTNVLGVECNNLSAARKLVLDRISREAKELQTCAMLQSPYLVGRQVTFPGLLPGPHAVWMPCGSSGACMSDELLAERLDWLVRDGLDEVQLRSAVEMLVYPSTPDYDD